jgi:hypothetical protein
MKPMPKVCRWNIAAYMGALLLLTACEEIVSAIDLCAPAGACEVQGVDVEMTQLVVEDTVAMALPFEVKFHLRNRGSESSAATTATICLTDCSRVQHTLNVPALKPGATFTGSTMVQPPADVWGIATLYVNVHISDAVSNENRSQSVHLEAPNLATSITSLAPEVQAATSVRVVLTVRNTATRARAAESVTQLCISQSSYLSSCLQGIEPVRIATPSLTAGATFTDTLNLSIPINALWHADEQDERWLVGCADVDRRLQQSRTDDDCGISGKLVVLPNLEARCDVRPIAPGQTLTGVLDAAGCSLRYASRSGVARFTAEANRTYRTALESYGGHVRIISSRGVVIDEGWETVHVTPTAGGAYYILFSRWGDGPYSLQLTQN